MNQQLFDEVVGAPPPSTVDVAAIVKRERRRGAVLRVGTTMAAVLVLAVSAGVTVSIAARPGGTAQPPSTTDTGFQLLADDRESAQATAQRLREALDHALKRAAPGAQWVSSNRYENPAPDGQPPNLFAADAPKEAQQMFNGGTGVAAEGRKGTLALDIVNFGPGAPCDTADPKCGAENALPSHEDNKRHMFLSCRGATGCTERIGPNGEQMVVATDSTKLQQFSGPWSFTSYDVRVELPDARTLSLTVTNEFGVGNQESSLQQQDPPLTVDQVTAIALDVASKIKP